MNTINKSSEKCSLCNNTNDLVKLKGKDVCKECIKELVKLK